MVEEAVAHQAAPPKDVESYLAALPLESRRTLKALRKSIKAVVPDATEVISYQMPAFRHNGRVVVWIAAWKEHCSLYLISQAVQKACEDELKDYDTSSKGTLRFPIGQPLPPPLVKKIVNARIEENKVHGTGYGKNSKKKGNQNGAGK